MTFSLTICIDACPLYTLQQGPLYGQKGVADALETTTALLLRHLVRPGCESLAHLNSFRVKIEKLQLSGNSSDLIVHCTSFSYSTVYYIISYYVIATLLYYLLVAR